MLDWNGSMVLWGCVARRAAVKLQRRAYASSLGHARCISVLADGEGRHLRGSCSAFLREGRYARQPVENASYSFYRLHQLNQAQSISIGRVVLEDEKKAEEEVPVRSPLTQVPGATTDATGATPAELKPKPKVVRAMRRDIPQGPSKMNLVAKVVRGMRVNDALIQMSVLVKRAAKTVYKVLHSARANAVHNYDFDAEKLIVAEAFVGKGRYLKRMWPHGKGKAGVRERKRCRLTVYLREMTPEEERKLAMLQKIQKQGKVVRHQKLLPHKMIETRWNRPRRVKRGPRPEEGTGTEARQQQEPR